MGASDSFAKLPHIGESVRRKEDYRFLTGAGQYTDDINLANQRYAVFVRSPHAHAAIQGIDTARAEAMPGVAKVFTGKDLEGNLCRCTGYHNIVKSIMAGARAMAATK